MRVLRASPRAVHPMPHEQNQDCADGCSHESPNETEHRNVQGSREHSTHKGSGYTDQDIGENAVIGLSDLFRDPSGKCSNHQHREEPNPGLPRNPCASSISYLQRVTFSQHPRYWSNEARSRVAKKLPIQPKRSSKGLGVPRGYPPRLFFEHPKWQLPIWHPPGLRQPSCLRAGSPGWSSGTQSQTAEGQAQQKNGRSPRSMRL